MPGAADSHRQLEKAESGFPYDGRREDPVSGSRRRVISSPHRIREMPESFIQKTQVGVVTPSDAAGGKNVNTFV